MGKQRVITRTQKITLVFGSLTLIFCIIEIGYRIFDPFPYFGSSEINHTEYGNLSTYDPILGWKGTPGGKAEFVTVNNRVLLSHNRHGFRDVEHNCVEDRKPAIVFLGDSFTWGYEVEFADMFVNRLRDMLPNYEIFNLSHRGYGTDQEFLTFQHWENDGPLQWVVLMFFENDIIENNSRFMYGKPKPKYEIDRNKLVLTGVPVPKPRFWKNAIHREETKPSLREKLAKSVFISHFLHDLWHRYKLLRDRFSKSKHFKPNRPSTLQKSHSEEWDLTLTYRILQELKEDVERRGAKLVVFFIPSKYVIEKLDDSVPHQVRMGDFCETLGIKHFDLTTNLSGTFFRTYYRQGGHWNSRGHQVVAKALYSYLTTDVFLLK